MDITKTKAFSQKSIMKWLLIGLSGISGLYFLLCLALIVGQSRLVFKPTKTIEKFPDEHQLDYLEVQLPVTSRDNLHGWWLLSTQQNNGHNKNKALLFLHGNGHNIGKNLFHANRFVNLGFSVLLMDYRGYGLSDGGFPREGFVYEDAQAMYDYLLEEQGFSPDQIFVYGHSLGGAIAINLMQTNPAAGLIVEGTFTSMSDMAAYAGYSSFFPIDWLLHQRFESLQKILDITTPTLFIHGLEDPVIPDSMSQQLHDAAIAPKQLYLVPEAGHSNVADTVGLAYNDTILNFVEFAHSQNPEAVNP